MSTEYKDWLNDFSEEQREVYKLCMEYPFLIPHDPFTGEMVDDFEYDYAMPLELPKGWRKLFLQMCADIKLILKREGLLEKFYFIQVKEKYNTMRCYHNGAPDEVEDIIQKYGIMASYICTMCGQPAVYETKGYIASFCDDCWKDFARHEKCELIEFKPKFKVSGFSKGQHYKKTVSFEDEWNRYIKSLGN